MAELIAFEDITKTFPGTVALDTVSFSIEAGEVHSLVGANGAGKSTLMNILGGQFHADSGRIMLKGEPVDFQNPHHAISSGVSIVYQELKLCENLTVAENVFLGNERFSGLGRLDWRTMNEEAQRILDELDAGVSARADVSALSVGKRQMVEIARALSHQSDIIVLDEPTSSLSKADADNLFRQVAQLRERGLTVIFISHRIEEIFRISDRITVLRDGKYLGTYAKDASTPDQIVSLIAGKDLSVELSREAGDHATGARVLEVKGLSRGRVVRDVSFSLHEGELLGVYGLQGSGRTELLECLFGLAQPSAGTIELHGRPVRIASASQAIDLGIALVPEDRRGAGILPNLNIRENMASVVPEGTVKMGFLRNSVINRIVEKYRNLFSIKMASVNQSIVNLSGGNQQKVIIAKWLSREPRVLLLDEVSKGIDVGAKAEIYRLIRGLKQEGVAIVMVSSEIEEILAEADRTLVMWSGSVVSDVPRERMVRSELMSLAMGVGSEPASTSKEKVDG